MTLTHISYYGSATGVSCFSICIISVSRVMLGLKTHLKKLDNSQVALIATAGFVSKTSHEVSKYFYSIPQNTACQWDDWVIPNKPARVSASPPTSNQQLGIFQWLNSCSQWIGLRENLQETMVFTIKYGGFRLKFSHHPIL